MMRINDNIDCCGIVELSDIYTAASTEHALMAVYRNLHEQAIVLFSEASDPEHAPITGDLLKKVRWNGCGDELKAYIEKHKLGTVVRLPAAMNPNSGNYVRAYLWRVNRTNMTKWGEKLVNTDLRFANYKIYFNPWRE